MKARVDPAATLRADDLGVGRRLVALGYLALAYVLYSWAWNTVDVLRPYIASDLKLSLTQSGSLYSAQALGALSGAVVNGQLADRFGRRNALMAVMIGFGLCLLAGTLVASYPQVLVQRLLLGYFTGSMYPITVGIYAGLFSVRVRGRVAAIIMGSSYLAVSLLGIAAAAVFAWRLDWHLLLWEGALPIVLALLAPLFVPDDRRMIPLGATAIATGTPGTLPISELFSPAFRRQTIMLTMVSGFNFFAYQAFNGWATTYLKTVRGLDDGAIGISVSWMFAGSVLGGFGWGWVGDRLGRRAAASGFFLTAVLILLYLYAPIAPATLNLIAFGYGACLACSVVWGPWLAELYPPHLKSTAASIFNWGRLFSFLAPLLTGQLAERFGLASTMTIASAVFCLAAWIWLSLPETLRRDDEAVPTAPPREELMKPYILTLSCIDQVGIVAAVAGALAAGNGFIVESQQFADLDSRRFFMRVAFVPGEPDMEAVRLQLAPVAERFAMAWQLADAAVPMRIVVAVSRFGHCLNDLLHRWRTGALPVEIGAVVSNHGDFRELVEWHGVPFHHLPVTAASRVEQEAAIVGLIEETGSELLGARPLYAGALARALPGTGGALHQHPPQLPAELPRRQALSPGTRTRREADRRDGPLRHPRSRRGADHRAGDRARRSRHQRRSDGDHRA